MLSSHRRGCPYSKQRQAPATSAIGDDGLGSGGLNNCRLAIDRLLDVPGGSGFLERLTLHWQSLRAKEGAGVNLLLTAVRPLDSRLEDRLITSLYLRDAGSTDSEGAWCCPTVGHDLRSMSKAC